MTKYEFDIALEPFKANITRLTNQLWKLIPMRENDENWEKQLETVIVEITGLQEIFCHDVNFIQLLSKLEGLKQSDLSFSSYRKTVFENIDFLQRCNHGK